LAAECLDLDEKLIFAATASFTTENPAIFEDPYTGQERKGVNTSIGKGTLFLTDKKRLVFVTKSFWGNKFAINHSIHIRDIRNVRAERGAFGSETLRIEYEPIDITETAEASSEGRIVARYKLHNVAVQPWISKIKELYYQT